MEYKVFGLTDTGKKRKQNQDNLLINKEHQIYIVCDGMGGAASGEVASEMTCDRLNEFLVEKRTLLEVSISPYLYALSFPTFSCILSMIVFAYSQCIYQKRER